MNSHSVRSYEDFSAFNARAACLLRALELIATIATCAALSGCPSGSFVPTDSADKSAGTALLGSNVWSSNGPYGGQIRSVAIDPVSSATVYAAGIGGVFKSTDGGTTWAPASTGITRYDQHIIVNAVVVSPSNRDTLFAAENTGVYKSIDGGANWASAGVAFIGSKAQTVAFDPVDANKIYVSANDRIYRSADGGNTWVSSFSGLNGTTPYSIAVAPGAVYAGTSNGLFKSVDGGVTWAASSTGFPVIGGGNSSPILTFTVAADSKTPTTLYATPRGQLHKSVDGGASWSALSAPGGYFFALDPQTPTTMYVSGEGVSRSTDGGVTWTTSHAGLSAPGYPRITSGGALAVDARITGTVFFGTFFGVFRSTNSGGTWAAVNAGLANLIVHVVAVDPLTPTTIYAGTRDRGIFKSTDGGASWADSSSGLYDPSGILGNWVLSLAIDPVTPSTIYAGTNNFVFKSVDSGATWKPARTGALTYLTPSLAINPLNPNIVVAGTLAGGVYRSVNAGASWTAVTAGLPSASTIYGLSFGSAVPQTLLAAVHPASGADLYLSSTDSGATWSALATSYGAANDAISVLNFLHDTLGIKSMALGYDAAFRPRYPLPYPAVSGGDVAECAVLTSVLFDPVVANLGFVGADCGVGMGTTARVAAINAGLPVAGVKALAITPTGKTVFAGLDGGSVYQISIDSKVRSMIEFYNPSFDYFFLTSRASDINVIDTLPAWRRTGKTFNVYAAQEPGTLGLSRYYFDQIAVNKSRGSHFYTVVQSEKDSLASVNPSNTQTPRLPYNEGIDSYAFAPLIEGLGGACAAGQTPVYRIFRGQARYPDNPNHRFTTDIAIYNSFAALGWDGEGVKFCAPN